MEKSEVRKSIVKAIKLLAADCNQEIKDLENLIEAWHVTLRSVTDADIWNGLKKALDRKNRFLIGSGEFKELALTGSGHDGIESEAREAWAAVRTNLNYYQYPVFKNSIISECIRKMGGWQKMCNMLESEEPFRERDFVAHYCTYKARGGDYDRNVISYRPDQNLVFIGFSCEKDVEEAETIIKARSELEFKVYKMIK